MKRSLRSMFVSRRTCHRLGRRLQHYLDGELDKTTTVLVEQHLETCPKCRLEVSTYTRIKSALARGVGNDGTARDEALDHLMRFAERLTGSEGPTL